MIQFARLDISDLKHRAQPHFIELDAATAVGDTQAAKRSRRIIQALARENLSSFPASSSSGIYMFCNRDTQNDWGDLRYIGCSNGPLSSRLMH
jgi:hypothetical protein